jgi:hypothetical protein
MLLSPHTHKRKKRGARVQGGKHQKTECKPKPGTKVEECAVMAKMSCSHEEEGQEPRGFTHLKKKATMIKKVTTTISPTSYTQERTKENKTMGAKH